MKSYISNGWATKYLVNPDACDTPTAASSVSADLSFTGEWTNIKQAYSQPAQVPSFNHGHIISYFISRTATDGLPAGDIKSINKAAKHLYDCGHVQNVEIGYTNTTIFIRAKCHPEMRKDRIYNLLMSIDQNCYDITAASCDCPAGKGPSASCKHVGALCYALVEFCASGKIPDFLTCTDRLQQWNKPRPKKIDPIPVAEFSKRKVDIVKKGNKDLYISEFDPRPSSKQVDNPSLLENLRVTLLGLNAPSALSQLLVAPEHIALHDHTYCSKATILSPPSLNNETPSESINNINITEIQQLIDAVHTVTFTKESLNVTSQERYNIESATREQARTHLWHFIRSRRITGSTCGKILRQQEMTPALLKSVLYPQQFVNIPQAVKWGIDNEPRAHREYLRYARAHGKTKLTTQQCGFIIHPTMGWFGASPDACIIDPHSEFPNGIAEFKCPYSKKELTPRDACEDSKFYCYYDGGIHLKKNHHYYHQVQLQLFVGGDKYSWCDFCVFTSKGIEVERIWPDTEWCTKCVTELDSYYDAYILPEILSPVYKPSCVL